MEVLSFIPGRIRLQKERIYKDSRLAQLMELYLNKIPAVKKSRVNPVIATVLVIYDDQRLDKTEIFKKIDEFDQFNKPYLDYLQEYYAGYLDAKEEAKLQLDKVVLFGVIYSLYKIKELSIGKSLFNTNLLILVVAATITLIKDYPFLNKVYRKLGDYFPTNTDKFLLLAGTLLTLLREGRGVFLLLLTAIADLLQTYSKLQIERIMVTDQTNNLELVWYQFQEEEYLVPLQELEIDDVIAVYENEVIPVDGLITEGRGKVNHIYYTGQPIKEDLSSGDKVCEGMILESGTIKIRINNIYDKNFKSDLEFKEMDLAKRVINYQNHSFIYALILATIGFLLTNDLLNFLSVLLVMSPSATSVALNIGLVSYTKLLLKHKLLLRNVNTIEKIKGSKAIAFDKTGILVGNDGEMFPEIPQLIMEVKNSGVNDMMILSGDIERNVKEIANKLEIKDYYYELSNKEKKELIDAQEGNIIMVGDGINDLAAMKAADFSLSYNDKDHRVVQAADCIILDNNIGSVSSLLRLTKKSYYQIERNIDFCQHYNLVFGLFSMVGYIGPFWAKSINTLNSIIVILNSTKITRINLIKENEEG